MGNICRSPTAEAVFRHVLGAQAAAAAVDIDSAGTHGYHVGEAPDPRAQAAAKRRGIDMSGLRARQLVAEDFERFDLLLVMDMQNRADALALAPPARRDRVKLLLDYALRPDRREVPDPYYGGEQDFELVLDLVDDASRGLMAQLRAPGGR